jgi:hypothetical protein
VNLKYGQSELEARNDDIFLRDIISIFTILKKRFDKSNFKTIAYKKNLINENL